MDRTGIIILAAGESSRLGRPKQTLYYNGKGLLQHVADEARQALLEPVIVITGAFAKLVLEKLDARSLTIVHNERWQGGMVTGIRLGIDLLMEDELLSSVIISVCDQPFLSAGVFTQLVEAKEHHAKGIIASAYAGTVGVPVLFDKKYFLALKELEEGEGAKKLIHFYKDDVAHIYFEAGAIDIDTEEDYNLLLDNSSEHSLQ
ncbi:MAG: nucleotidyltransferase family protein [Chitinophagaceae bacterium]